MTFTLGEQRGNFSAGRGIAREKAALHSPGNQEPSPPSPGCLCSGLVISQLNISQGWSHHLVWFKVKLPEWDGRTDLFFLALLPPFSPAQQKKKN